jgi:hypothetical protein
VIRPRIRMQLKLRYTWPTHLALLFDQIAPRLPL